MKIDDDFIASLRSEPVGDDELKVSLLSAGWDENLPAIRDEHGVLLVGNRRMAIAKANDITPVEVVVTFGEGSEADAARARLAVVSNTGSAGLTPTDRKRVAERLYKDGMTQAAIGAVMGVSQATVSGDLVNLSTVDNSNSRPKTESNPRGAGRPRGSGTKTSVKPATYVAPKPRVEANPEAVQREQVVGALMAQGLPTAQIAKEIGLGERNTAQVIEHVKIDKEAYERGFAEGAAQATLDPQKMFNSVEKQVEQRVNKLARDIYKNFDIDVDDAVANKLNIRRKEIEELEARANRIINSRRGVLTDKEYRSIWSLLHGDMNASEMKLVEAYNIWQEKREYLVLDAKPVKPEVIPDFGEATTHLQNTRLAEVRAKNNARRAERAVKQALAQEIAQVAE